MVERLRAELPESPSSGSPGSRRELDLERALVLVTGGLDGLYEATVAAGADRVAAANVIANNLVGAGVDPSRGRRRRARAARRGARPDPAAGLRRGDREGRRRRLRGRAVPRAGGRLGRLRARSGDRRDHRRQSRPGGGVQGRQGGPARLLRRPGDEGDGRHGEPARRERARAREAGLRLQPHPLLPATTTGIIRVCGAR